jgi:hypothetical protein
VLAPNSQCSHPERQRRQHRHAHQGSESRPPPDPGRGAGARCAGRRRRHGRWRRRGPDEHGHLHAVPAVAAAADEVEPARGVEAEDEVAAAAVAEDRAAAVARLVRRLVHLDHVVPVLLVVEFCIDAEQGSAHGRLRHQSVLSLCEGENDTEPVADVELVPIRPVGVVDVGCPVLAAADD